jgi:hypothetical protein
MLGGEPEAMVVRVGEGMVWMKEVVEASTGKVRGPD